MRRKMQIECGVVVGSLSQPSADCLKNFRSVLDAATVVNVGLASRTVYRNLSCVTFPLRYSFPVLYGLWYISLPCIAQVRTRTVNKR